MQSITQYFAEFTPKQLAQLQQLAPLYKEWNEKINVISRKDIDSLYQKHVLHSLAIAALFQFLPAMQVIDIGTGGGFPGIPLAIFFPDTHFHLVDSIQKKIQVVNAVADGIGLTNITTQHTRAEAITHQKFDVAVSRAVAPLKDLLFWSKPILKKNPAPKKTDPPTASGLICLKGGNLSAEIQESKAKPRVWAIQDFFGDAVFQDKYVLQVV